MRTNFKAVDSYIKTFPAEVQPILTHAQNLREAAPMQEMA